MTPPRLSVVVPFYGVENYIGACLESIQQQRLRDLEVILVDDGSPDGSRAVAEKFAAEDSRFRLITQENAGLGPARNTGAAHSGGEYITFIDSDDLVTQHSFERMLHSLDSTGSSFAAGNARRFNNTMGVRPSWTHLRPFAQTRFATHVLEMPVLARDRMVWNKVYRRSFWDEFGYAFPAIRYEDYPVTLKAHLDAVTVDVLSDPVYYWRERESGDSITQQVYRADNLLDRVRSANMVLDLVVDSPADVRQQTQTMLAETDYIAIVQAFENVPDDDVEQVLDLGHELVDRLGYAAIARRTRYDQLQYVALMNRDVPLLRDLAHFRGGGGLRGGHRGQLVGRSRRRREFDYPGRGRADLPRHLFVTPTSDLGLRTAVEQLHWDGQDLIVRGTAEVRQVRSDAGSTMRLWATSKTRRVALKVMRHEAIDSHGDLSDVGFTVRLDRGTLRRFAADDYPIRLDVQVGASSVNRTALLKGLRPGSPQQQPGTWLEPDLWARPTSTRAGELQIGWTRNPSVIVAAVAEGDTIRFTAELPRAVQVAHVLLTGSRYAEELEYPGVCTVDQGRSRVEFTLPLDDIQARTDDDDPYLGTTTRSLRVRAVGETQPLVWAAPNQTAVATRGEHQFLLTRSPAGYGTLREMSLRLVADTVTLARHDDGDAIVVAGHNTTGETEWSFGWRRYLPGTENFVVAPATHTCDSSGWSVTTPVSALLDIVAERDPIDPLAIVADWALFATTSEEDTSVLADPFLISRLPVMCQIKHRHGTVIPRSDTLHLQVRDTRSIERR